MAEQSRGLVPKALLILMFVFTALQLHAQAWLPGYNYRKKITINKSLVGGTVDLLNFQLLVALEDADLRYHAGDCGTNKLSGSKGRDFAFTLVSAPQTPLSFQLDQYEASTGRLLSWVKLPSLAAAGSKTAATQLYLYYGSNTIHFPAAAAAQATWDSDVYGAWHMNAEAYGTSLQNGKSNVPGERLQPSGTMSSANFVSGKIGTAISLNGLNQQLTSGSLRDANFYISCWIKLRRTNKEQVILSTDSAAFGGFVFKINAEGKLVLDTRINSSILSKVAPTVLLADRWYHVSALYSASKRDFFIDGVLDYTSVNSMGVRLGGTIIVGANKDGSGHFDGLIDELRVQSNVPTVAWASASYTNQRDPATFYVVSPEEINSVIVPTGMVFTAVKSESWSDPSNWNSGAVPGNMEQVIVKSGTRVVLSGQPGLVLNKLTLEANSTLDLQQNMEVLCTTSLAPSSVLSIGDGHLLQLDGLLRNDGRLTSAANAINGGLNFSGSLSPQVVSGSGSLSVQQLLINKSTPASILLLEQPTAVFNHLRPMLGILNSNGFLSLKNNGASGTAFLWPIAGSGQASVEGEVTVEQYVSGSFPAPASARGWRLLSAAVYHGDAAGGYNYHLHDFKGAMFVTGPGGLLNGFDSSPQNGHTIYTHDQSITGSLSQKYQSIPTMNTTVKMGSGIYAFSRGSRLVVDAYVKQIQTPPFAGPEPYVLKHKGLLFQGSLQVPLQNRNRAEPGDGFNLMGNPYAATLRWGQLQKEHLSPYIWKFNPLNNAYDVSSDPEIVIDIGEGFFVKVLNGFASGSLVFEETAKATAAVQRTEASRSTDASINPIAAARKSSSPSTSLEAQSPGIVRISLSLSRDVFEQKCMLVLQDSGHDEVDDQDAVALGSGYVSISSIAENRNHLSVDIRQLPLRRKLEVPIYVKGYLSGRYELRIAGLGTLEPGSALILEDRYLQRRISIDTDQVYSFDLNTAVAESFGEGRFAVVFQPKEPAIAEPAPVVADHQLHELQIYPNPFLEAFKVMFPPVKPFRMEVRLRDLMGQLLIRRDLGLVTGGEPLTVDAAGLPAGIYLLQVLNLDTGKTIATSRLIKR